MMNNEDKRHSPEGTVVKNKTVANTGGEKGPPVLVDEGDKSNVVTHVRENAELDCPLIGNPPPLYEWSKGGERIDEKWDRFSLIQGRLIIRSVIHEDSGSYVCRAINGFGLNSFSTQLTVTGDDPQKDNFLKSPTSKRSNANESLPEIVWENLPPSDKTLTEPKGKTLQLKCESRGNPKPNVTWYKDSKNLTSSKDVIATLKLFNLTEKDNGKYRCESWNKLGKSVYEVALRVTEAWQGAAEILELNPSNLTLYPGQSGRITCLARLEGATLPLMVWVKIVDQTPESDNTDKPLFHDGFFYEVLLNKTDMHEKSKNTYVSVLPINNATVADAGTYRCLVIGPMGFNHSKAQVIIEADPHHAQIDMDKRKSATVQRTILWTFAFLILVVLMVVCLSRLYGCRGPLKNSSGTTIGKMPGVPKPLTSNAQVPKRSPGETLSTTLTQTHNDVLQPLVDGHNSRTTSVSVSASRRQGAGTNGRHKLCLSEHMHLSVTSSHSNNSSSAIADSDTSSSKNVNYVEANDSTAMYFVNDVDTMPFSNSMLASGKVHRSRDRNHRDRDKYRKRWSRTHASNEIHHGSPSSTTHLPVPAPSCESLFSEDSGSSALHYYYEPRRHHHQHYYQHSHKCPKDVSPTHLSKCLVTNN
ncbi:unnamed protein product [Allacma fusca]|uniref:Ig-like domain-containing protein n=1 Tax=Allacma fusca TaxID=39272 RepID=A0A8J2LGP2_9HEXA|nr:unnamed protein product [Allacma fusca]